MHVTARSIHKPTFILKASRTYGRIVMVLCNRGASSCETPQMRFPRPCVVNPGTKEIDWRGADSSTETRPGQSAPGCDRATVHPTKTGKPVRFEMPEQTRECGQRLHRRRGQEVGKVPLRQPSWSGSTHNDAPIRSVGLPITGTRLLCWCSSD